MNDLNIFMILLTSDQTKASVVCTHNPSPPIAITPQPSINIDLRVTMRSLLVVLGLITALYAFALPVPQINSDCEFVTTHSVSTHVLQVSDIDI